MSDRDLETPPPTSQVVHVYDGIEEEDNRLPSWWLAILFGSVVFSFGYWFVFHTVKKAPSPREAWENAHAEVVKRRAAAGVVNDDVIAVLAKDPAVVGEAKKTFVTMCAPCHEPNGQGKVGPNLTDKFWLHGHTPMDIHKSITGGFPDKGMPPWGDILGAEKVRQLAALVVAMKGQNLPGKEPQGTPVE